MLSEIKFNDKEHSYTNKFGKRYTSVTTVIGFYKNKFDADFWTTYKAIQKALGITQENKKQMSALYTKNGGNWNTLPIEPLKKICAIKNIDINNLLEEKKSIAEGWAQTSKESCERGTRFHEKMEAEAYNNGIGTIKEETVETIYEYNIDLSQLKDGYHAEVLLYNHDYEVAGIMDKLIISTVIKDRYIKGDDWKTNKVINTINPVGTKMKYPLHHLDDCNYIHYALQLNTYLWLLSQFGYIPQFPSQFTHVILDINEKEIGRKTFVLPNLQTDVKAMLEHFKNNKK